MPDLTDVDRQFRDLHNEVVHTYEQKLTQDKKLRERSAKLGVQRHKQVRDIMRASQLSLEALDRLEEEDKSTLQNFLADVRPSLVERSTHESKDAKKFALHSSLQIQNWSLGTVYGATLLAGDNANLNENPGEQGNPWILPSNPGKVKIKATMGGVGWGCVERPLGISEYAQVVFWFLFIPDKTAMWYLLALVNLHGFYIMRANDEWWNCKHSSVSVQGGVDVYQYYWNGEKRFGLLGIDSGNISSNSLWDDYAQFDYQAGLRAGDWAWVKVSISLDAYAQGDGSYSELNFSDGTANYIEPLIVAARPL